MPTMDNCNIMNAWIFFPMHLMTRTAMITNIHIVVFFVGLWVTEKVDNFSRLISLLPLPITEYSPHIHEPYGKFPFQRIYLELENPV